MTGPDDAPTSDGITPRHGAGSADLVTDSTDPAELRALLARARERLSFYEGFDRMIAENVRRSGELMLEALATRERAADAASAQEESRRAEALESIEVLESSLASIRSQVAAMADQLDALRRALDRQPAEPDAEPRPVAAAATAPTASAPTPDESDVETWESPRVVELIAHGVGRAALALSLQRHVGALDGIDGVEAREFAEGVLRLQVTTRRPLQEADLTSWDGQPSIRLLKTETNLIEVALD